MSLALLFPGQGSQSQGMLSSLNEAFSSVSATFERAHSVTGIDFWDISQNGPIEKLNSTEITQPAVLTASYAIYQVYRELGLPEPDYVAGHSLGEYTALVVAGVMRFEDAVALVHLRGQLMQNAVPIGEGGMAAVIGLKDEEVNEVCQSISSQEGELVEGVNYNAPGQVVIAGKSSSISLAVSLLKEKGARKVMPLTVSVPAHSSLMKAAAESLQERINQIEMQAPVMPVVQNVTACQTTSLEEIKKNLLAQLYSPVQWSSSVIKLRDLGVNIMAECGPGKVLSGLNKRITKEIPCFAMDSLDALQKIKEELAK